MREIFLGSLYALRDPPAMNVGNSEQFLEGQLSGEKLRKMKRWSRWMTVVEVGAVAGGPGVDLDSFTGSPSANA